MPRTIVLIAVALALVALLVLLVLLRPSPPREGVRLFPEDARFVTLGARVYAAECAVCHGRNLGGAPGWQTGGRGAGVPAPPLDASGRAWQRADADLFALVKEGPPRDRRGPFSRSNMPAYGGVLTDREILAVLSFVASTWPPAVRAARSGMVERGGL